MHSPKGRLQKAAETLWQMCLPFLTAFVILAGAVGAISLVKREIPDVPGITDDLLRLVPWLVPIVAGWRLASPSGCCRSPPPAAAN